MKNRHINFFDLSPNEKTLLPNYINKKYYGEQIDLVLYKGHHCLKTNSQKLLKNNENYRRLCRRRLKNYENQSKFEKHMSRCIEQENCNVSDMHLKQKRKFNHSYKKVDPSMLISADIECMNAPVDDNQVDSNVDSTSQAGSANKKLFVSKPIAVCYNVVKNPDYDNL